MGKLITILIQLLLSISTLTTTHAQPIEQMIPPLPIQNDDAEFYSNKGREHVVIYRATYHTQLDSLQSFASYTDDRKDSFLREQVVPLISYLFGPAGHRDIGSPQKNYRAKVLWSTARLINGSVAVDYEVKGDWILHRRISSRGQFELPVPNSQIAVFSSQWRNCTDSEPEHQTRNFYWYYWDPSRWGCDQVEGEHYQMVTLNIGAATENQKSSYPEYDKILRSAGKDNNLQMTFAFGYVATPEQPNPEKDSDYGIVQYRRFLDHVRRQYPFLKETLIYQREYVGYHRPDAIMGHRFTGKKDGVDITLNVVASGEVDQMEIFSKSFAHDHDGFFAWFGHSRLGAGFDADHLAWRLSADPDYYTISENYQFIYWGGCNSYSYYSLPFFRFKAQKLGERDPHGTRTLDILTNGMPSLFALNEVNARISLHTLMNWRQRYSYQQIVDSIEEQAARYGTNVLVAILGDEDNTY